ARVVGRMFGRLREFDTLVRLWSRLPMAQVPTSVVVRGEPGIGKSLLAGVMAEYVRRTGGDVRVLYSEEGYEHKPFHPVRIHLLEELSLAGAEGDDQDRQRRRALSRFLYPETADDAAPQD